MPAYRRTPKSPWRFRKWILLPDGTRHRIHGVPEVNTKKAAEAAERDAIANALDPAARERRQKERDDRNRTVPTVDEYKAKFLDGSTARDKPTAIKAKKQILEAYILPRFGHMRLDEIRQHDVDLFVGDLLSGTAAKRKKALSRKTINNITSVLGTLLRYALRNGDIDRVGLVLFMQSDVKELNALEALDLEKLLGVCRDLRYRVALLLANDCGMRVGELRALRWSDIDEIGRRASISQAFDSDGNLGPPKTWRARTIPISERLWEAMGELVPVGQRATSGYVLTKIGSQEPLSYWAVRDKLVGLYEVAKVPRPDQPWHCLRHAFCTRLAGANVPLPIIQDLAGHKSIETTRRYIHVNDREKRDAIAKAFGCNLGAAAPQKSEKPG